MISSSRFLLKQLPKLGPQASPQIRVLSSKVPGTLLGEGGVHGNFKSSGSWRNKPLFRREGDARFKTGTEASTMLINEARRRDGNNLEFIESVESTLGVLSVVFDRSPKYAWIAKQLLEPERSIHFRVAWIDDLGVTRMNRGYRIQYSSALGPYEGSLHFGHQINSSVLKSFGFDTVFRNSLTSFGQGASVGGADFNPLDKSEAEIQRFCQSFMTELTKYIGPDLDIPYMGMGVGSTEIGYLYGQYKRINVKGGAGGKPFLWGGTPTFPQATGFGVVHFAKEMLEDKGDSLVGKRCLIIGSGKVAQDVAAKLLDLGAVPICFSDSSGHVYEPEGFDKGKLKTVQKVKSERGARIGRYIIASTTAQYNNPESIYDIPHDICFPCCCTIDGIGKDEIGQLVNSGCQLLVEGGESLVSNAARKEIKKQNLLYGPHIATLLGSQLVAGAERFQNHRVTDQELAGEVKRVFKEIKLTASEFNTRGDLYAGANIAGFLRVAHTMSHLGAV